MFNVFFLHEENFFFMNKTFNIKKADTTVPAFVISFHKVVAKDSYNSYFSLVFS